MATIRTAFQLQDGMTPVFRSMNTALNTCISSFEAVQTASSHAVNTANLAAAKTEIVRTSAAMDSVEQNIRESDAAQRQLNNDMRQGQSDADGLASKVKNMAVGIIAAVGGGKILGMSDTMAQMTSRLDMINDATQSTAELQEKVFQSAQRTRSSYIDTAGSVAKLGILAKDAFSGNDEAIFFAEQMNKQFVIGNASIQEQSAGMYQLTQAMAAGKLQGDEFRSITETAPMLAQAIAQYTGKTMGQLKEMSSEGLITANVIKNALFAAADATNAKFASMPKTFAQVWQTAKNSAIRAFEPVLMQISGIVNSQGFQSMTEGAINGLIILANVAATVFNEVVYYGGLIKDNWSLIEPVVWSVVTAYTAYNGAALIANGIIAAQAGITGIAAFKAQAHAAALMMQSGATFMATVAQHGLNAALYACPTTWIIMAIVALIAIFYLVIAAMNKWAGTSLSATGFIVGAIYSVAAIIANVFITAYNLVIDVFSTMWNFIATFAEFLMNVFTSPIESIIRLFGAMADVVLGILSGIAGAIDTLFGTNLRAAVENCRKIFGSLTKEKFGAVKYELPRGNPDALRLNRFNVGQAWESGKAMGTNIGNMGIGDIALPGAGTGNNVAANIAETAANTGKMKDSLDISTEDLKYLRDIAEQEVINRYTTAEIKIDMPTNNHISSNMDLDGVVTHLKDTLIETVQTAAEKVHK